MKQFKQIILASGSPRRKELLSQAGLTFDVIKSTEDEEITEDAPDRIVMKLAEKKAESVAKTLSPAAGPEKNALGKEQKESAGTDPGSLIIGADTIVVLDGRILGKPKNRVEALSMLMSLSGRKHEVYTGVSVLELPETISAPGAKLQKDSLSPDPVTGDLREADSPALLFAEKTQVEMEPYNKETALSFIETGIPMDKAGAYAIQGLGSFLVKGIIGDFHSVMGFPLGRFLREGIARGWFRI